MLGVNIAGAQGGARVLVRVGAQIGRGTNNAAEYHALLAGMRHALRLGLWDLTVRSDSLLVVHQVKGQWKVKDRRLRHLRDEAANLARLFRAFDIAYVPRESNADADALSRTLMFEEPSLPPLPRGADYKFPRSLYAWQAAAIRVWWLNHHPGSHTLARIFGTQSSTMEQIGHGKTYRDATLSDFPAYLNSLVAPVQAG